MDYMIRKLEEHELPRLLEMCASHAEYEKAAYNPTGKHQALQSLVFGNDARLFCYVIEAGGPLVGYFTYTFDISTWDAGKYLHLDCLYLEPPYRGHRIGDHVFAKLIDIARKHNCIAMQWQTPVFNEKAIRFYKRIGAVGKDKVRFFLVP